MSENQDELKVQIKAWPVSYTHLALRAGVDSGGGDDAAFFLLLHGLQQIPEFPGPVPRFQTGVELSLIHI